MTFKNRNLSSKTSLISFLSIPIGIFIALVLIACAMIFATNNLFMVQLPYDFTTISSIIIFYVTFKSLFSTFAEIKK